ncbi:hypothetical protein V6N12_067007 [Hibiscus sabdariffa]|uniref:Uncharacterized protein n=1 Tax=Hibiscus sabdariffa TaxID=183260 RepID=A0ABR2BKK1_9ROSI
MCSTCAKCYIVSPRSIALARVGELVHWQPPQPGPAFAYYGKFPTAASRRSLGRVSVPVWLIILSDQLLIIALVSYCLTN